MLPLKRLVDSNRLIVLGFLAGSAVACTTGDGEKPGSGGPAAGGTGPGGVPVGSNPGGVSIACDGASSPGVSPLLKLSTIQYRNTIRDLLKAVGASSVLASVESLLASVPEDSLGGGFRGLDHRTSLEHVQGYFNVGVAVGDAVAREPALLAAVAGACANEAALSATCVDAFLDGFMARAYRRPLSETDRAEYASLNDGQRTPAEAIRAMLVVGLSSPRLAYHVEIDGAAVAALPDLLQLTSYEIASRLSYTFWQTLPDQKLWAAAEDGSLATDVGFAAQLERVFTDPRTRDTLWQFWGEWMSFEKFTGFETTRPAFQALAAGESVGVAGHEHYQDMLSEVRSLTELFTFGRSATVADLLTTELSVTQSPDLAKLYGVAPWSGSGEYPKLPAGTRQGLLQRAALLVSNLEQTNPFHRGAFIRRSVLCDPLPQPDPNSLPPGSLDPPPASSAQTTRQRFFAKIDGNTLCIGCHGSFSDIGFVMESFDSLGRYRTTEKVYDEQTGAELAALPIDTSALVRITPDDTTVASGPADLNLRLVQSQKVEACLAQHYFKYATRRAAEDASTDACVVQDLSASLRDPQVGLAGAFRRLAQYSGFFQRKVGPK